MTLLKNMTKNHLKTCGKTKFSILLPRLLKLHPNLFT